MRDTVLATFKVEVMGFEPPLFRAREDPPYPLTRETVRKATQQGNELLVPHHFALVLDLSRQTRPKNENRSLAASCASISPPRSSAGMGHHSVVDLHSVRIRPAYESGRPMAAIRRFISSSDTSST
jgi:hypothetical protein